MKLRLPVPLLFAATCLISCREAAPPELRIGLLGVMSGPMAAASGIPGQRGAQLAVDEINLAGGVVIQGVAHRIRLIDRGIENRPSDAAVAARALINLDSVDVIVGPQTSALAIAAVGVAEASGVPIVSPMASNPAVTAGRRFAFRLAFLDAFQGSLLARFAHDSLGVRRAAALHDAASPYGRDIVALFRTTFEALGGEIVGVETFDVDAPMDYETQLRRLLARRPDAILLPNYAVHDTIQVRQARALGFRGRFLGTDSWDPVVMQHIPGAAGSVVIANWDRRMGQDASRRFVAAYEERVGDRPRTTAVATYDAIRLVARAAAAAGSRDGEAIAAAIRTSGRWEGAGATYVFHGHGDPRRGGVVIEILVGGDSLRLVATPEP